MSGILLLEDEPIIARNICRALARDGHAVTHAATAHEGRAWLAAGRFDLVLADVNLGDGDGIEVLGSAAAVLSDVPIVIMTGQDTIDNRLRAEGISVSAFLSKPFAMSRLAELTGALLAETGKQAGMRRGLVSITVDSNGSIAQVARGSHDATGNFATIGDQDFCKCHCNAQFGLRF